MTYPKALGLLEPSRAPWTPLDHEHATTAEVVAHAHTRAACLYAHGRHGPRQTNSTPARTYSNASPTDERQRLFEH